MVIKYDEVDHPILIRHFSLTVIYEDHLTDALFGHLRYVSLLFPLLLRFRFAFLVPDFDFFR